MDPQGSREYRKPGVHWREWSDCNGYVGLDTWHLPWLPYDTDEELSDPWALVEDVEVLSRLGICRRRRWSELDSEFDDALATLSPADWSAPELESPPVSRGGFRMMKFHMHWAYQDRIEPAHHAYVLYACEQMADEGVDDATCSDLSGNGQDYPDERTVDAGPGVGRDVAEGEPGRTRAGTPDGGSGTDGTRTSRAPGSKAEVHHALPQVGSIGGVSDSTAKETPMDT